jgi:DNA-binding transcriptional LysR family regulator
MIPTPHALRLPGMVSELLSGVELMVSVSTIFDPATSRRRFRIGTSDCLSITVFTRLVPRLQQLAPHITLELVQPPDRMSAALDQVDLDLVLTPAEHTAPDHPTELLFEERHVVAGWSGNLAFDTPMTEEVFLAAGHVVVEIGRLRPTSFAETLLRKRGKQGTIEFMVSSFAVAPEMLMNTNRLAIMHERLAHGYASRLPLTYADLPFDFPVMFEMLQDHTTGAEDRGLRWLTGEIRQARKYSSN